MAGTFGHAGLNQADVLGNSAYSGSFIFLMGSNNSDNKWTKLGDSNAPDSILVPHIVPVDVNLVAATITQALTGADPVIQIFINETLTATWTAPTNIQIAWNIEQSPFFVPASQGDRLAVFIANGSDTGKGIVTIYWAPTLPVNKVEGSTASF